MVHYTVITAFYRLWLQKWPVPVRRIKIALYFYWMSVAYICHSWQSSFGICFSLFPNIPAVSCNSFVTDVLTPLISSSSVIQYLHCLHDLPFHILQPLRRNIFHLEKLSVNVVYLQWVSHDYPTHNYFSDFHVPFTNERSVSYIQVPVYFSEYIYVPVHIFCFSIHSIMNIFVV